MASLGPRHDEHDNRQKRFEKDQSAHPASRAPRPVPRPTACHSSGVEMDNPASVATSRSRVQFRPSALPIQRKAGEAVAPTPQPTANPVANTGTSNTGFNIPVAATVMTSL